MKTLSQILSLTVVLGISACGTADNTASINDNMDTLSVVKVDELAHNEEAVLRRTARVAPLGGCLRSGNVDTWKSLSLTTDQIRWVEELQGQMKNRNDNATASVDKEAGDPSLYTFNAAERRRLAEILTDEQLEKWMDLCPQ
ncbi:MAG: hypothetical protein ABI432_07210 [Flavobacteriales bacterium]